MENKKIFLDKKEIFTDILGQDKVKKQLRSALLTDRHIILVGPPGVGKTTLAKNLASVMGTKNFIRIQGSPDLTAEDLLGDIDPVKALKFGPLSIEAFTKGKIFKADKGILFFDELNRCPEKLQNALLQVLSEKKATIGSYDVDFDLDFIFIGTMNPEDSSTEKLSDVLLDRFDLIYVSYPETLEIEEKIVLEEGKKLDVEFDLKLIQRVIEFIRDLREDDKLERKPSVRASLGLYERAQANAMLRGKKKVDFDDVTEAVESVLSHRVSLKPSVKYLQDPREFVREQFSKFSEKAEADRGDLR
jgi:MoxR-like ATPase